MFSKSNKIWPLLIWGSMLRGKNCIDKLCFLKFKVVKYAWEMRKCNLRSRFAIERDNWNIDNAVYLKTFLRNLDSSLSVYYFSKWRKLFMSYFNESKVKILINRNLNNIWWFSTLLWSCSGTLCNKLGKPIRKEASQNL